MFRTHRMFCCLFVSLAVLSMDELGLLVLGGDRGRRNERIDGLDIQSLGVGGGRRRGRALRVVLRHREEISGNRKWILLCCVCGEFLKFEDCIESPG